MPLDRGIIRRSDRIELMDLAEDGMALTEDTDAEQAFTAPDALLELKRSARGRAARTFGSTTASSRGRDR